MFKYILPNVVPLILLEMAFMVNWAITAEASIAFLGFGDPNRAQLGQILHIASTGNARVAWWWVLAPGLAIVLLLLSIFFVARALEEVVDPRLRRR